MLYTQKQIYLPLYSVARRRSAVLDGFDDMRENGGQLAEWRRHADGTRYFAFNGSGKSVLFVTKSKYFTFYDKYAAFLHTISLFKCQDRI